MKLNAHWAFPVYLGLKDQSHEKCVKKKPYKKDRAPKQSNSWIVKTKRRPKIASLLFVLKPNCKDDMSTHD